MKADYKNWVPKGMIYGLGAATAGLAGAAVAARRNPQGRMVGIDRWGAEYASYSQKLCKRNAQAEGVTNVSFQYGDACRLDFADESFDVVTSNYVYHNIAGKNKQKLLKETLRVLKKGGTFAIHDMMEPVRYGDMEKFVEDLKAEGYEDVQLIPTADGLFMNKLESRFMMLYGSTLLVGRK